ncbi:hypothetical protein ACRAWG_29360 [Methylobacterium sp. P31]
MLRKLFLASFTFAAAIAPVAQGNAAPVIDPLAGPVGQSIVHEAGCIGGVGWHFDPYGRRVWGNWRNCTANYVAVRRCRRGYGWHFDPYGRRVWGPWSNNC